MIKFIKKNPEVFFVLLVGCSIIVTLILYTFYPTTDQYISLLSSLSAFSLVLLTAVYVIVLMKQYNLSTQKKEIEIKLQQIYNLFPFLVEYREKFQTGQALPKDKIPDMMKTIPFVQGDLGKLLFRYFESSYICHIIGVNEDQEKEQKGIRMDVGPKINDVVMEQYKNVVNDLHKQFS